MGPVRKDNQQMPQRSIKDGQGSPATGFSISKRVSVGGKVQGIS